MNYCVLSISTNQVTYAGENQRQAEAAKNGGNVMGYGDTPGAARKVARQARTARLRHVESIAVVDVETGKLIGVWNDVHCAAKCLTAGRCFGKGSTANEAMEQAEKQRGAILAANGR